MKAVFMAGGMGTRISSVASDIPKPMIRIGGKPVLEHEIECLRSQGFTDIIITVSHMAEQITNYFKDGSDFGVSIEYFVERQPLGNAGALLKLRDRLTEDFLLLNADVLFNIDFERFIHYHKSKNALVTLFTHPNSHPYDSGIVISDSEGYVTSWLTKEEPHPQWYSNRINAGLHIINPEVIDLCGIDSETVSKEVNEKAIKVDLDRNILKPLCGSRKMVCYDSPEYVRDMGTPDRFEAVCRDLAGGIVQAKSLKEKQRAVFLDRDGTINRYVGFLNDIDRFELLPGAAEAIRRINSSGYLAIVVTNQPVIARGELSFGELEEMHCKMETLLGREGAYLDGIYYCPHHPDSGFDGEVPELKIKCSCRKPEPGMLLAAAERFNIDLSSSWMVGDGRHDIGAGKAAGCMTALIGTEDMGQDLTVTSLLGFTEKALPDI